MREQNTRMWMVHGGAVSSGLKSRSCRHRPPRQPRLGLRGSAGHPKRVESRLATPHALLVEYEARGAVHEGLAGPGLRLIGAGGKVQKGTFLTVEAVEGDVVRLESIQSIKTGRRGGWGLDRRQPGGLSFRHSVILSCVQKKAENSTNWTQAAYDRRSSRCHGARGPEKPRNLRRVSPQAAYDRTSSCCHGVRRAKKPMKMIANSAPRWPMTE